MISANNASGVNHGYSKLSQVYATYVLTFKRRINTQRRSTVHKQWRSGDLEDYEAMSSVWLKIIDLQLLRYTMNKSSHSLLLSYYLPNLSRKSQAHARRQRNMFRPSALRVTLLQSIFTKTFNKLYFHFKPLQFFSLVLSKETSCAVE